MKNVHVIVIASSLASDHSLVLSDRAETEKLLKKAKNVKADKIMTPGKTCQLLMKAGFNLPSIMWGGLNARASKLEAYGHCAYQIANARLSCIYK